MAHICNTLNEICQIGIITTNTITDFNILYEQLLEIKKSHIAFESEEITEHLCCYEVPIVLPDKSQIALSISLPLFRTDGKP